VPTRYTAAYLKSACYSYWPLQVRITSHRESRPYEMLTLLYIETLNGSPVIMMQRLGPERALNSGTGYSISQVQPVVCASRLTRTNIIPFGITGVVSIFLGEMGLTLEFGDWGYRHRFCVCSLYTEADGIVGIDIL
jgi:hypothetical protein